MGSFIDFSRSQLVVGNAYMTFVVKLCISTLLNIYVGFTICQSFICVGLVQYEKIIP